jgi:basic amino acid/polyamine antiporter, APA family
LFVSTVSAVLAAITPIEMAVQLANIGSLAAFIIVALAVMILRWRSPEIPRPFKTPLMPLIPILAVIFCSLLIIELPLLTQVRFLIWLLFGLIIYYFYGRKKSKLNIDT